MTNTPISDIKVVDADTHYTEPWDLWTSRAPAAFKDRVPRVLDVDGQLSWVFDGVPVGPALAGCCINVDDIKVRGADYVFQARIADSTRSSWDVVPRLKTMDGHGIWAQIVYPNAVGFGGQKMAQVSDLAVRTLSVKIFNDAMAQVQEESGDRMFPMAMVPWWEPIDDVVAELERARSMGLRGLNTSADPHEAGMPELGSTYWDPMWDALEGLDMPLNFHIGASVTQHSYFGSAPWPSSTTDEKMALGSAVLYLGNARIMGNMIYSGILERHPALKVVSVESGVSWLPFFLEALDYQVEEMSAAGSTAKLTMAPSEYFRRQCYACFWFESKLLIPAIQELGEDNCMFETDFPHPTCLYPDPLQRADKALEHASESLRQKVFSKNAASVYNLPLPA